MQATHIVLPAECTPIPLDCGPPFGCVDTSALRFNTTRPGLRIAHEICEFQLSAVICICRSYVSWATLQQLAFLFGKNWVAFAGAATALEFAFQKGLIARRA